MTLCTCSLPGSSDYGDSSGKNIGLGCHAFLQGIFPTQGSNPGLPHCGQILYCLSHQGSPKILEQIAYPFSRGSSPPRNQTRSPALQANSLPDELPGKPVWVEAKRPFSGLAHKTLLRYSPFCLKTDEHSHFRSQGLQRRIYKTKGASVPESLLRYLFWNTPEWEKKVHFL